jgi:uncharacterized phage-associated protein
MPQQKYVCEKSGWRLSNLPLQKILHLAQVEYAGQHPGERLTDTVFEAWDYGPVSPDLYQKIKMFAAAPVRDIFYDARRLKQNSERKAVLDAVCGKFLSERPGKLIKVTHWGGGAWAKKYERGTRNIRLTDIGIWEEYRNRERYREEWQAANSD